MGRGSVRCPTLIMELQRLFLGFQWEGDLAKESCCMGCVNFEKIFNSKLLGSFFRPL